MHIYTHVYIYTVKTIDHTNYNNNNNTWKSRTGSYHEKMNERPKPIVYLKSTANIGRVKNWKYKENKREREREKFYRV